MLLVRCKKVISSSNWQNIAIFLDDNLLDLAPYVYHLFPSMGQENVCLVEYGHCFELNFFFVFCIEKFLFHSVVLCSSTDN